MTEKKVLGEDVVSANGAASFRAGQEIDDEMIKLWKLEDKTMTAAAARKAAAKDGDETPRKTAKPAARPVARQAGAAPKSTDNDVDPSPADPNGAANASDRHGL